MLNGNYKVYLKLKECIKTNYTNIRSYKTLQLVETTKILQLTKQAIGFVRNYEIEFICNKKMIITSKIKPKIVIKINSRTRSTIISLPFKQQLIHLKPKIFISNTDCMLIGFILENVYAKHNKKNWKFGKEKKRRLVTHLMFVLFPCLNALLHQVAEFKSVDEALKIYDFIIENIAANYMKIGALVKKGMLQQYVLRKNDKAIKSYQDAYKICKKINCYDLIFVLTCLYPIFHNSKNLPLKIWFPESLHKIICKKLNKHFGPYLKSQIALLVTGFTKEENIELKIFIVRIYECYIKYAILNKIKLSNKLLHKFYLTQHRTHGLSLEDLFDLAVSKNNFLIALALYDEENKLNPANIDFYIKFIIFTIDQNQTIIANKLLNKLSEYSKAVESSKYAIIFYLLNGNAKQAKKCKFGNISNLELITINNYLGKKVAKNLKIILNKIESKINTVSKKNKHNKRNKKRKIKKKRKQQKKLFMKADEKQQTMKPKTKIEKKPPTPIYIPGSKINPEIIEIIKAIQNKCPVIMIIGSAMLRHLYNKPPTDYDMLVGCNLDEIKLFIPKKYSVTFIEGEHPHLVVKYGKNKTVDINTLIYKTMVVICKRIDYQTTKKLYQTIFRLVDRFIVLMCIDNGKLTMIDIIWFDDRTNNIRFQQITKKHKSKLFNKLWNSYIQQLKKRKKNTIYKFFIKNHIITVHIAKLFEVTDIEIPLKRYLRGGTATITSIGWSYNQKENVFYTKDDFFGGLLHLKSKKVVLIHNPTTTFNQSPEKAYRIIYYAIAFGFELKEKTLKSLQKRKDLLFKKPYAPHPNTIYKYIKKLLLEDGAATIKYINSNKLWHLVPLFKLPNSKFPTERDIIFYIECFTELRKAVRNIQQIKEEIIIPAILLYPNIHEALKTFTMILQQSRCWRTFYSVVHNLIINEEYFKPFKAAANFFAAIDTIRHVIVYRNASIPKKSDISKKLTIETKLLLKGFEIAYDKKPKIPKTEIIKKHGIFAPKKQKIPNKNPDNMKSILENAWRGESYYQNYWMCNLL
ncbi:MAG: hypothetical protein PVI75_01510 [Gammaproteobacteria bacterium]|jgi:tRNA nucleotidyltransferase/poly(A) polymerase